MQFSLEWCLPDSSISGISLYCISMMIEHIQKVNVGNLNGKISFLCLQHKAKTTGNWKPKFKLYRYNATNIQVWGVNCQDYLHDCSKKSDYWDVNIEGQKGMSHSKYVDIWLVQGQKVTRMYLWKQILKFGLDFAIFVKLIKKTTM